MPRKKTSTSTFSLNTTISPRNIRRLTIIQGGTRINLLLECKIDAEFSQQYMRSCLDCGRIPLLSIGSDSPRKCRQELIETIRELFCNTLPLFNYFEPNLQGQLTEEQGTMNFSINLPLTTKRQIHFTAINTQICEQLYRTINNFLLDKKNKGDITEFSINTVGTHVLSLEPANTPIINTVDQPNMSSSSSSSMSASSTLESSTPTAGAKRSRSTDDDSNTRENKREKGESSSSASQPVAVGDNELSANSLSAEAPSLTAPNSPTLFCPPSPSQEEMLQEFIAEVAELERQSQLDPFNLPSPFDISFKPG